jgi:hypothetical protein
MQRSFCAVAFFLLVLISGGKSSLIHIVMMFCISSCTFCNFTVSHMYCSPFHVFASSMTCLTFRNAYVTSSTSFCDSCKFCFSISTFFSYEFRSSLAFYLRFVSGYLVGHVELRTWSCSLSVSSHASLSCTTNPSTLSSSVCEPVKNRVLSISSTDRGCDLDGVSCTYGSTVLGNVFGCGIGRERAVRGAVDGCVIGGALLLETCFLRLVFESLFWDSFLRLLLRLLFETPFEALWLIWTQPSLQAKGNSIRLIAFEWSEATVDETSVSTSLNESQ